jgi:elongation factor G
MANSAASGPTTQQIRNVIVVGHTGTGKSTLVEGMLRRATHQGQRDSSHPVVDFTDEEQARGHSLQVATVSFEFDGCRFNVIDTPGGPEAIGDTLPALAGADTAVFVVDASVGIQPQHDQIWRECERMGMPRIVFLNKLDLERAQYQSNIDALRLRYGKPLAPVHMPLGIHEEFDGVIDLLHFNAVEFHDGKRIEEDVPEQRVEQARSNRETLIEAVVENDDEMLERYLEGEVPDTKELAELFAHGVAECGFFPVLCGSVEQDIGIELLMHFLVEECPSPAESHLGVPTDGPTAAVCLKTMSDQYLGRINLLRLVSGRFTADDTLTNTRTSDALRLHQVFRMIGKEQDPISSVNAGDVFAVAKVDGIRTGDVLTADGQPLDITIPESPVGHHRVVLHPKTASDDDKLSTALQRLLDEDPSIHTERDEDRGLLICSFLGQGHVDVTIDRMQRLFGVGVTAEPAPVAFRETIQDKASGIGKHVKQSGGHGQYGIAQIEIAPLGRGEGFAWTASSASACSAAAPSVAVSSRRSSTEEADDIAARTGARLEDHPGRRARRGAGVIKDRGLPLPRRGLTDDPLPADAFGRRGRRRRRRRRGDGWPRARRHLIRRALELGKPVVTANKELIAHEGPELYEVARAAGVDLAYEAAVAGAIPIIKPLKESLAGDRITRVVGILNGTTNYILTRMTEEGATYADVLAEAQALGYAEADPTADVGGHDAAAKCAILASLAFDTDVHATTSSARASRRSPPPTSRWPTGSATSSSCSASPARPTTRSPSASTRPSCRSDPPARRASASRSTPSTSRPTRPAS